MDPIIAVLDKDLVSYAEKGEPGQTCVASFSSNLLGGKKGSLVHKYIWEKQKEKMKVSCSDRKKGDRGDTVCCNARGKKCNVPWAGLGEGVSHPAYNELLNKGDIFETFCFADEFSFVPDHFAYALEHIPAKDAAVKYIEERGIKKALDRLVYHLFNAITPLHKMKCGALFDTRRFIGHLYTEAFKSDRGKEPVPSSEESDAFIAAHPEFAKFQQVHNGWQPCDAGTEAEASPEAQKSEAGSCSIFTLWEYTKGPPMSVGLNVEGWRRHSKGRCGEPVLINDANVMQYIPDMPEEYFRMPYAQAKSDIIRYALLYHHGGIYMDTDFLVVQDLDAVIDLALSYDLVSYTDESTGSLEVDACSKHFSSNFMAGKKGSTFMKNVWEKQKSLMVSHCPLSDKDKEKVCCFDQTKEQCHIPWAGIGEGVSHPVFEEMETNGVAMKSYCFSDDKGFTPPDMINILEKVQSVKKADDAWRKMNKLSAHDPLGRIMYHTFNSIMPWQGYKCNELLDNNTVYGRLNVMSFTTGHGKDPRPESPASKEFFSKNKVLAKYSNTHPGGFPCAL